MTDFKQLQDIAHRLRVNCVRATNASKSGHPTSCASIAEIISVLFFDTMSYSVTNPRDPASDRFVLSKGHAAPILYSVWAEAGLFPVDEVLNLRKVDSFLEGHPTPRLDFVDVATGSLGQGINCAAGMAFMGKKLDKADFKVYCVMGDGESAEGSVWEALSFATIHKLDNLVAIFDVNRLGQSEATPYGHQMDVYKARCEAFGMETYVVDGHSVEELVETFNLVKSSKNGKPKAVVCKTLKGKSLPGMEDQVEWHGKPAGAAGDQLIAHLQSCMSTQKTTLKPKAPEAKLAPVDLSSVKLSEPPNYSTTQKVATRQAYGFALQKLGRSNARVLAFDGDTKNSTFSDIFRKEFPDRFGECYIAEQNMVGVGVGAACRDRSIVFISTFATFFTRAFDHLRMAAISQSNINCVGSHCGVSIGEDGPSQMALEDIAMFRAIPNTTIFYPSDAVATERAVELAAQTKGITFIRTSRPATSMIYMNDETFEVGKAKIVSQNGSLDQVLVIAAGVTLYEALCASDILAKTQTHIRIMDPFTVKPLDRQAILEHAKAVQFRVIVVEDHYAEGGLGEAVLSVLAGQSQIPLKFVHLAVREVPRSGPPDVLLEKYGISAKNIVSAVNKLVNN